MHPSDEPEAEQAQPSDHGEAAPRFRLVVSDRTYQTHPKAPAAAACDPYGLVKSFADTQQFTLTGPLLSPMGAVNPSYPWSSVHSVLSRITGSSEFTCQARSQMGDVTVWSMPAAQVGGLYSRGLVNLAHSGAPRAPSSEERIELTDSQREVLTRSAEGLSSQEVAHLLGCAEVTVNNHLRSALTVLSCGTKALAVLKAARLGLIPCLQ